MATELVRTESLKLVCVTFGMFALLGCSKNEPNTEKLNPRLFDGKIAINNPQVLASPDYQIRFPQDHLAHPEYAIEWWYLTANLFDEKGNQYPLQWTLFRFRDQNFRKDATQHPWSDGQRYMAHAKLISAQHNWFEERFARGGVGNVAVELSGEDQSQFSAYIDDWIWQSNTPELLPATLKFTINSHLAIDLSLSAEPNYILHGNQGFSEKLSDGSQASMYYSEPFIRASGTIKKEIDGEKGEIHVAGHAWFDHEWSSQLVDSHSLGWDWFSIHLDDGRKLMLFNMRHAEQGNFWSGTLIESNGNAKHLRPTEIDSKVTKKVIVKGKKLPLEWQITILDQDISLFISPFKNDQWSEGTFEYYEGAIQVSGTVKGTGFIELTGY